MYYTIKQLRYAEAAERHRSITAAAEALAISPSSVAAAIDHLEAQAEQPIFTRTPSRGIVATRYGRSFIAEVRRLLAAQTEFDNRISALGQSLDGVARIACFTPLAPILLPMILSDMRKQHPRLMIDIKEGDLEEIVRAVDEDEADFAICYGPVQEMTFRFLPLFTGYPHAALPSAHPLASQPFVTLEQLAPEPLVALDLELSRRYLMDLFAARGLTPNVVYSARSTDMMRAMIAAGMCYGVFNIRPMSKQTYARGDLVRLPLVGRHDAPKAGIIVRRDIRLSPACAAIIDGCETQAMMGTFDQAIIPPHIPQKS